MNNPLITDVMVENAIEAMNYYSGFADKITQESVRSALEAAYSDMVHPVYKLMESWKRDTHAYESALRIIRANKSLNAQDIADEALKGGMHIEPIDDVQRYKAALQAILLHHDQVRGDPLIHDIAWNAMGGIVITVAAVAVAYQLINPPHEYKGTVTQAKGRNL
jgi:hypothetical protein